MENSKEKVQLCIIIGKLTHFGQGVYQGEFENGKKHGFGSYTFEKKSLKYVGDYYHDMKEG